MGRHGGIAAALAVALGIAGCGGTTSETGDGLRVSGTVGAGYAVAAARGGMLDRLVAWAGLGTPAYADGAQPAVDRVVALRVQRGSLTMGSLLEGQEAEVDPDGTFAMTLKKDADWILVLVDSTARGAERYVGAVEIAAEDLPDASLMTLPATTTERGSVDLGTLARVSPGGGTGDAIASNEVVPQDFGMTVGELLALARTDDVFRNARNIVANHDRETGTWYGIVAAFAWVNDSPVAPGFSSPAASSFDGYGFQVDTNSTSVGIDNVCGNAAQRIEVGLFPPVEVVMSAPAGATYGPAKGMTNDEVGDCGVVPGGRTATDRDFMAGTNDAFMERTISYGFSQVSFGYPIPAGDWTWREDGQVRAVFDLSLAAPMAADGRQGGFVPSIRVAAGDDGRVTAIDVRWSYWDASTGAYVEVVPSEEGSLAHSLRQAEIGLFERGHDVDTCEKAMFDPSAQATIVPAGAWYYGVEPPSGGKLLGRVIVFFESGGIARTTRFDGFPAAP